MRKLTRIALALSLFSLPLLSFSGPLSLSVAQAIQEIPSVSQHNALVMSSLSYQGTPGLLPALNSELVNSLGMKFRLIPKGSFMMGSPASEKDRGSNEVQHRVTLSSDYYMQTTEVTQGQWQAVMGTSVSEQRDKANKNWSLAGESENHPMYYVSWDDVQAFIRKLNTRGEGQYRLPTEAEWEYAARARSESAYSFSESASQLDLYGWYDKNSGESAQSVGQKQANAYGLHDMNGNVSEWVSDWLGSYPSSAITDPSGVSSGRFRVIRGGTWYDPADSSRSACRFFMEPYVRSVFTGFRLVKTR